ncbi:MAG: hypothetical protein QOI60_353 [Actinomycetota bacterium]|nr:hypothetical protein [Actinomycetota bacterium]
MAKKKRKPRIQPSRPPVKSEKRQEERKQRAEAERRAAKARRKRSLLIRLGAGVIFAIGVYTILQLFRHTSPHTPPTFAPSSSPTVDPSILPGIQDGNAPWTAGNDDANLKARLTATGIGALPEEGSVLHIHQHLDVFVNGNPVVVPESIGIPADASFISPIHTHTPDGIIHVESPTRRDFTLGQFFDVWGVKFTSTCIGGYCNSGDATVSVYVNGFKVTEDPGRVLLTSHAEIVVAYGTPPQLPDPIPSSHTFSAGL